MNLLAASIIGLGRPQGEGSYVLSRLSFFFLSRRGGEISVPRTEGKGRRSITCGLTEHSAPLSAKGRIGRLLFPILFQNTLQKTSEPPPLPRVASIARLPRSFLNKFPSETRSSLPFGYRWNRDASDVACPGENCGIPYQYRNGDTRKYKMEKELNGVTFKRCYWISLWFLCREIKILSRDKIPFPFTKMSRTIVSARSVPILRGICSRGNGEKKSSSRISGNGKLITSFLRGGALAENTKIHSIRGTRSGLWWVTKASFQSP